MPVEPRRRLSGVDQVAFVERARLGLDREREAGWGNRDAVDIAAPATRERVPQPPPLRLQPAEGSTHRVFGPSPDATAGGQAHPATSVEHQRDHHQRQHSRQGGRADACGGRRQRAGDDRCGAARAGPAQSPGLLTTRKAQPEHRHKLARASDTPPPPGFEPA